MELREIVHQLTELIWQGQQRAEHVTDDAILAYVRDAVGAEIEYRRRVRELDSRLSGLKIPQEVVAPALTRR